MSDKPNDEQCTVETDAEKFESLLRYMEATGDLRPLGNALKLFCVLQWRNFWRKR